MMSQARFGAIYAGLTAVAKKVYDAVPIEQDWTTLQISTELRRGNTNVDFHIVAGCLNSLIEAGLVREPAKGRFRREGVRAAPPPKPSTNEDDAMKPAIQSVKPAAAVAPPLCPVDRLGKLAERIIGMAAMLRDLGAEVSDAALDLEAQNEESAAGLEKLKQLQSLLKSLG